ncbi:MAG: Ig-like domain-containing protein [Rikenellaceae bacterium]
MKRLFTSFMVLSALLATALVTSCTENDSELVSFDSFSITLPTNGQTLYVGDTFQIELNTSPVIDDWASNIKFSVAPASSSQTCVYVSETGLITAVEAGEANIVVSSRDGEHTLLVSVVVVDVVVPAESVTIDGTYEVNYDGVKYTDEVNLAELVSPSLYLTATVMPEDTTAPAVTWSVSDLGGTGTTVDSESGLVTYGSYPGTVTVIVTLFDSTAFYDAGFVDGDDASAYTFEDKLIITLTDETKSISISPTTLLLDLVETTSSTLSYTLYKIDEATSTLVWTSSDTSVVTVSNGVVTAVNAGEAEITLSCDDVVSAPCSVTVAPSGMVVGDLTDGGSTF